MLKVIKLSMFIVFLVFIQTNLVNSFSEEVPAPEVNYQQYYNAYTLNNRFSGQFYPRLENSINELKPNVGGDVFYDFHLPELLLNTKTEEEIDRLIYKALIAFSTQKGIEYYSYRRKSYRIFIEKSHAVHSVQDKRYKNDPILLDNEAIPVAKEFYVYQEDSSFGKGVKSVTIFYNKEAHQFYIKIINEETVKYQGLVSVAKPQDSIVGIIINRNKNHLNMYGISATKSSAFGSLRKRTSISMVYRIYALAMWFKQSILETF